MSQDINVYTEINQTVACRAAVACDLVNPILSIILILASSHELLDVFVVTVNGSAKSTELLLTFVITMVTDQDL